MKSNRNPLYTAMHTALVTGVVAGMTTTPVIAQDQDETAELERVQVTGSRISRTDIEGALPVIVIDRETIELSGRTSIADLLRNTPINTAGSFRPQSGSTAQAFAGISLRGLGEERTLVLLDGRRLPKAPNVGNSQDLNIIPIGAVERIEILSDGASAVYGSDAIAGVVNIITRKDFEGAEIMYGFSDPKRPGGDTEEGHVLFGVTGDRGRLMAGASFNQRDIIFQRQRAWSQGGASSFSNNFVEGSAAGPFLNHPQFGSVVPGDGCTGEGFTITGSGADAICHYDFTLQAADEAEIRNEALYTRASYDLNIDWMVYFNAGVSRVQSFGRYAPVPSVPWPGGAPFLPVGSPNHPATRPEDGGLNPEWEQYQDFADQPLWFDHRFAALGPRDDSSENNLYDIDIGVDGRLGGWDLNFGARHTESQYTELQRNYVVGDLAQAAIESGAYNIYDPFSVDADTANSMIATVNRDANYRQREIYASASTDLVDLPAGPLGFAFGGEYREEDYRDIFDSLSEAGQIVGTAGNSAAGGRDVSAVFAEFLVPITHDLELSVAGRYDDYSDYGSDFSPKLALRYQPFNQLTLRASWGEGFRAPPLDIITQQPAFSAATVVHAPTANFLGVPPDQSIQITTFSIANPDLDSENSEQWSLGVAFQPTDWLNGSLDYYDITIKDAIGSVGAQTVINCLEGVTLNCPDGLSVFSEDDTVPDPDLGLGMAFRPDGSIPFGQTGFANFGEFETRGLDLNLRTNFDFGRAGRLNNELQATYVNRFAVNGNDVVGTVGLPRIRATLSNTYNISDFAFAWNIEWIRGQSTSLADPDVGLPSWIIHDLQGNWHTPWNGQLSVGVQNVLDRDPPIDFGEQRDFNFDLYHGYGRIPYVRYTQRF